MSKTDKTRPWRVKMAEHPVEHHDHIKGYCDLPELSTEPDERPDVFRKGLCYWDCQWWRTEFRCGCGMCGYPSRSRELRQADRLAIKEGLHDVWDV